MHAKQKTFGVKSGQKANRGGSFTAFKGKEKKPVFAFKYPVYSCTGIVTFFVSQSLWWQMFLRAVTDVNVFDGCCHVHLVNVIFTLLTHWQIYKDPSEPKTHFSFSSIKLRDDTLSLLTVYFFHLEKGIKSGATNYCPLCAMNYFFSFPVSTQGGWHWWSGWRLVVKHQTLFAGCKSSIFRDTLWIVDLHLAFIFNLCTFP